MGRIIAILVVGIGAGLAYLALAPGFGILIGGPDRASIVNMTRATLVGSPTASDPAEVATIRPSGLCSRRDDGSHLCTVEVDWGTHRETLELVFRKDAAGRWQVVR